jgi:hypothetical protein
MGVVRPSTQDLALLMDLGEDIIEAWYGGTPGSTEEYYNLATDTWEWNATEAGGAAGRTDWKPGLSALAATMYRFKRPRDPVFRRRYRDMAIRSTDRYFKDFQDPVTGGLFRSSAANVAGDSGETTFMALSNIAIVVACLNGTKRWATQILAALDYASGRNERTYYTNGNFMIYKLVAYQLGARMSDFDPTRVGHVDDLWEFTYDPTTAVGNPSLWRGCGYIEDEPAVGYFSEVTDTNSAVDHRGTNRYDAIYTWAQSGFATVGYLTSGDPRFLDAAIACARKSLPISDPDTNLFAYTGGSRTPGSIQRVVDLPTIPLAAWVADVPEIGGRLETFLYEEDYGFDTEYRKYLTTTHATLVRGFGLNVAASIIAAHGVPL